jgi:hypothetical protein
MNLMPFAVLGGLLVLSVLVLLVMRQVIARREDDTLHVLHGVSAVSEQSAVAQKLEVIDKWGKLLTVVAIVYCSIIGALFMYQQWTRASNLGM